MDYAILRSRTRTLAIAAIIALSGSGLGMLAGCSSSHSSESSAAQPTDSTATTEPADAAPAAGSSADVLTYHNDNARTGLYADEKILTPRNVNSHDFGKIAFLSVQGLVDAQPLYVSQLKIGRASCRETVYM